MGALFGCRSLPLPPSESSTLPARVAAPVDPAPKPDGLLPSPDFSPARVRGFAAGIRPYRRGAIRIELDELAGRPLVHDYGHGGAGITLARGSAHEVLELLSARRRAPASVAVLGAGINGLTAATVLAEAGYEVSVYADRFTPHTTSDVAGGQFAPSLVATGRDDRERALFQRLVRRSWIEYSQLVERGFGVLRRPNYTVGSAGGGLRRLPQDLAPPVQRLERLPFAGSERSGSVYQTFLIEPPRHLARLQADLVARGVPLVERRFGRRAELEQLPGDALVNCLGLGAGALFDDEALVPIRGQLVHLEPQELPYLLSHRGYLFPRSDVVVLGGSAERGVTDVRPDRARCEGILRLHAEFFGGSGVA